MSQKRRRLRALLLAAVSTSAAAASIHPDIFERASNPTCATGFTQCSQAGLPSNFCCSSGTSCTLLAGATTVLCCPDGADCSKIAPITCDLAQQNATLHPDAPIKTTALRGNMAQCGSDGGCCPFGFSCVGNSKCVMDANQNAAPIQSGAPASTSAAPATATTAGVEPTTPPTATTGASQAAPAQGEEGGGSNPTGAIVGGVIGGAIAIALIAVAVCIFRAKRRKKALALKRSSSTSSFGGNYISHPILKSDTIGYAQSTPTSQSGSRHAGRPGSGDSTGDDMSYSQPASPTHTQFMGGMRESVQVPPIRNMRTAPMTPRAQREPSQEINVFADPSTVGSRRRDSTKTSFSTMMEEADLGDVRRGAPFVPGSNYSTPASRRR